MKKIITMSSFFILTNILLNSSVAVGYIPTIGHHTEDPYRDIKDENMREVTLMQNESYLSYIVKIKKAANVYVKDMIRINQVPLQSLEMKGVMKNLYLQDPSMLVKSNLFKKDNLYLSLEKGSNVELIINLANEGQCSVIIYKYLKDEDTKYIILNNKLINPKETINNNNSLAYKCEKENEIKLSTI